MKNIENKSYNRGFEKQSYSVLVNVVVVKDGKILLSQRSMNEEHEPGKWTIPGGKIEFTGVVHNALQKTAKREVFEETGIKVKDEMYLLTNNTFNHEKDKLLVIAIVFLCFYKSGRARPSEEVIDVRWISLKDVNNYQFPHPNVKNYVLKGFEEMLSKKKIMKDVK